MGLQEMLMSRVEELSERSMRAGETMRGIKELHQIKSNMQSACDSLKVWRWRLCEMWALDVAGSHRAVRVVCSCGCCV